MIHLARFLSDQHGHLSNIKQRIFYDVFQRDNNASYQKTCSILGKMLKNCIVM